MNSLWRGLLVASLLLAVVPVVCAEPTAEIAASAQPEPTASNVDGSTTTAAPASELIKVSRLEPSVTTSAVAAAEDRQLELRKADFRKFAEGKLKDMNRNHILSRERMRIEKRSDGSYKASFHQLDDSSLSYQVSRSSAKAAQYVAVLSYKERVFTASCGTPAACKQGEFTPVEVIPNRHIFVYNKGVWQ